MKRKLLLTLLALTMVFACTFALVACGKGDDNPGTTPPDTEQGDNSGENGDNTTPHTHSYTESVVAPTCTEQGYTLHACTCGDSYKDSYIPASHTEVIDKAVAATCTTTGLTQGKHCSACGTVIVAQQETPVTEHSYAIGHCLDCGKFSVTESLIYSKIDGGYAVTGISTSADTHVYIPSEHNGEKVVKIGDSAFSGCGNIISITFDGTKAQWIALDKGVDWDDGTGGYTVQCTDGKIDKSGNTVYESAGLEFTLLADGKGYALTGTGTCTDTEIIIPSTYNGKPVIRIGLYTYEEALNLSEEEQEAIMENLIFGESVTSAVIPDSVNTIACFAFAMSNIPTVDIPDSVTVIDACAFAYCNNLSSITIGERVKVIQYGAFMNCGNLTSITVPDSVTYLGECAFSGCGSLKTAVIGNGVASIKEETFHECEKLQNITLGKSITVIDEKAFDSRRYDEYIYVNYTGDIAGWCVIDGLFYLGPRVTYINGTELNGKLVIPDGVTSIGAHAFDGCGIISVTIPDSVTSIGALAFSDCGFLTSVSLGNGLTSIGNAAFYGCGSLKSITIPDGVTSIGNGTFSRCGNLESLTIGSGVTSIGEAAFDDYGSLTTVYYTGGIAGWCGISGLNNLMKGRTLYIDGAEVNGVLVIPDGVTSIGDFAFSGCPVTSISVPDSVTSIGYRAFSGCNITDIRFTGGIALWCGISGLNNLMSSNSALYINGIELTGNLVIPEGVTTIGQYAFYGCSGLTGITIADGVTSIGEYAFYGCGGLTEISISDSVTTIGQYAFYGCSGLTGITIADGVTSIGEYAFYGCGGLTEISISDSVTTIGQYAFYDCNSLTNITLGSGVTSIGIKAFTDTWSLKYNEYDNACYLGNSANPYVVLIKATNTFVTSCTVNESTKIIYADAFKNCYNLTSISVPDSVIEIGNSVFANCNSLTTVSIGNGVTSIVSNVFSGCNSIKYNEYDNAFYLGNSVNPYVILIKAKDTFVTSCTVNENTKIIYANAFKNCYNLTSITVPDSVIKIGSSAFSGCGNLTNVIIGKGVTYIGSTVFNNCGKLTSITVPDSVTYIDGKAFTSCYYVETITFGGTIELWNAIEKGFDWNCYFDRYTVQCTDGKLDKYGNVIG